MSFCIKTLTLLQQYLCSAPDFPFAWLRAWHWQHCHSRHLQFFQAVQCSICQVHAYLRKKYQPLAVHLFSRTSLSRRTKWGIPPNLPRYCSWKTRSASACASVSQSTQPPRSKSISILSLNWSYLVNMAMLVTLCHHTTSKQTTFSNPTHAYVNFSLRSALNHKSNDVKRTASPVVKAGSFLFCILWSVP